MITFFNLKLNKMKTTIYFTFCKYDLSCNPVDSNYDKLISYTYTSGESLKS